MATRTTIREQDIPAAIAVEDRSDLPLDRANLITRLQALAPAIKSYGVTALYLYGSYARGDADAYSDIDVFVEYALPFTLIDLVKVQHIIEDAVNVHVDVTTRSALGSVKEAAERDAVRVI